MRFVMSIPLLLAVALQLPAQPRVEKVDVCVYAATAGGISAAITAIKEGKKVLLIEPGKHLGGMTTGGLGWTDFGNKAAIGGLAREFYRRVGKHYGKEEAS